MANFSEPAYGSADTQPTYVAGGPVQADNGVYLTRAADRRLLDLCLSRTFAYVLTSRQMGKSSLMVRTAEELLRQGAKSVIIDLTGFGSWVSAEQWYGGILEAIASQLEIAGAREWWRMHPQLGIAQRFCDFFRDVVLTAILEPVVIFVDEIDSTLSLAFSDDFFAAIRSLYHLRVNSPSLNRLSFVLIGVASPNELMKDATRTPFNIGQRVELTDFTEDEARPLVAGLNLSSIEATLFLQWVLGWTGGHPYLTLRVFRKYQEDSLRWVTDDGVIRKLFFGRGESPDSNLEFIRKTILRDDPIRDGVFATYDKLCYGQVVRDESSAVKTRLKLSGLVSAVDGELRIRNRIYEEVFDRSWLETVSSELKRESMERRPLPQSPAPSTADAAVLAGDIPERPKVERWKSLRLTKDNLERSILVAVESIEHDPPPEATEFLHWNSPLLRRQILLISHGLRVTSVAFSPDGQYAASASEDCTARIFEIGTGFEMAVVTHRDRIWSVAFSPDSKSLATASWDGTARVWSVRGGRLIAEVPHADCVTAAIFFPDGLSVVTASWDHSARIWDIRAVLRDLRSSSNAAVVEKRVFKHEDRVSDLAMTPDGELLATASWDHTAKLWNAQSGAGLGTFSHTNRVTSVAVSADGRTVATASEDRTAGIWDARTGSRIAELKHEGRVTAVVISDDGTRVATASEDRTARTWALSTGEELTRMPHSGRVSRVAFGGNDRLITSSEDATARIWDARTGRELGRLSHEGRVVSAAFSSNAAMAISAGEDRTARVWDAAKASEARLHAHSDQVRAIAVAPDGNRLASASEDGTARIWDALGESLRVTHAGRVTSAGFSPDGRLLTASEDGYACVWDSEGRMTARLRHPSWVYCAAFHRDNQRVFTGCEDGAVRVWHAETRLEIQSWSHQARVWALSVDGAGERIISGGADAWVRARHTESYQPLWDFDCGEPVYCLATSPRGSLVAGGDASGRIRIWDARDGALTHDFPSSKGAYSLGFSPDGRFLIAGYGDGAIVVWELNTGREIVRWNEAGRVYGVAFYPDGKLVAVAANHEIRVSLWASEDLAAFARARLTRNLTQEEWNEYFEGEPYRKTCPHLP